jgi:sugar phosphate isomerase/epimerase
VTGLDRLSINQMTTRRWSVAELVDGCARAGIPAVGLWREPVAEIGVAEAATRVADAGLRVSSLCRGGFLTAIDAAEHARAMADNRRAIDEAAALGTDCLVMVVGGLPEGSTDLTGARQRVADAIAELAPHARERGVRLALEPLHPMYCADRAVLSTLAQALDIARGFAADQVGVVIDTFHVWWDPELSHQIAGAGERIASYQICDWLTPLPADVLLGRGIPGDGHIDFTTITRAVTSAGYTGDIEVEIFNQQVWDTDPDMVLATIADRYRRLVSEWASQ